MSLATDKTLMWFRQDLRIYDNPALVSACLSSTVFPVYIYDRSHATDSALGGASQWWLQQSLLALNKALNHSLTVLSGEPLSQLLTLLAHTGATQVVWNRSYEPWQIQCDKHIKTHLKQAGYTVHSFNGSLLWEPWQILTKTGTVYKVFTPFYRKGCLTAPPPRLPLDAPKNPVYQAIAELNQGIDSLALLPKINWYHTIAQRWEPGEQAAQQHLAAFLENTIQQYPQARNIPSLNGTSSLSPYLHFGELSIHQLWHAVLTHASSNSEDNANDCFLSELGWREFSHYLLYHFPDLPSQNFNKKFNDFAWCPADEKLRAWQRGQTGVPIIDAGMRELWQTGFMHNRVRMLVGSYLVKNLRLHWQHGAAWFWECLVDADLAANSASWQWVAGSGADAAPFFRIFNPVLQGEKFDPEGDYVRHYCPELQHLPNAFIHQPWAAPLSILSQAGITLGQTYPYPLVDLKLSRQHALEAYQAIKNKPSQPEP